MQMITLDPGDSAPEGADWIAITQNYTGAFTVYGSIANKHDVVVVSSSCKSFEAAKLVAWEWAQESGSELVYLNEGHHWSVGS